MGHEVMCNLFQGRTHGAAWPRPAVAHTLYLSSLHQLVLFIFGHTRHLCHNLHPRPRSLRQALSEGGWWAGRGKGGRLREVPGLQCETIVLYAPGTT